MSITPLRFTGVSSYSEDFQTILQRAVQIASLPMQQMLNKQSDVISKQQLLSSLGPKVQELAESVAALGGQGTKQGLAVSSSNSSKVSATLTGTGTPSSYVISNIDSIARRASEATQTGLASSDATAVDAVDNILELYFDGEAYEIDLTTYGNNLEGLREAIQDVITENELGLNVSLINSGDGATPYHLVLSATDLGTTTLELWTGAVQTGSNLLTSVNQGANTTFALNGVAISKKETLISGVIPGVNLSIRDTTDPGEVITVDLSSSRSTVETALSRFVNAYNAVAGDLTAQTGEAGGLLSGDGLINYTKGVLRNLTGYSDSGGMIESLADFGIELDTTGKMTLNTSTLYGLSNAEFADGFRFLGSETTGFGALTASLDQISSPFLMTDMIDSQVNNYKSSDERLQEQVETLTERILLMQTTMMRQLQQADVLLASLEGQQRMLDASIQAMEYSVYGKKNS